MNNRIQHAPIEINQPEPGVIPTCHAGPESLVGIPRLQTNPSLWQGDGWQEFVAVLAGKGIAVELRKSARTLYITDAGGMAYGLPRGVLIARSTEMVAEVLRAAQQFRVPVTVRGGGLTTEGETVSFGGL